MMLMEKITNDNYYGSYFVEYCIEMSADLLRKYDISKYSKMDDELKSLYFGRFAKIIRPQTQFDFCFLLGFPFYDINSEWDEPNCQYNKECERLGIKLKNKLPIGIERKIIFDFIKKYPEIEAK